MKKTFTLLLVLVLGCISVKAVPAYPFKKTVTLSDGSKVELTLRGDEHYKFYSGNDGFAYRKVNNKFERFSMAQAHSEWSSKITRANSERRARTRGVGTATSNLTGKKKGLVILMQFKDLSFVTENVQNTLRNYSSEDYTVASFDLGASSEEADNYAIDSSLFLNLVFSIFFL